jgi:hypothetical protein
MNGGMPEVGTAGDAHLLTVPQVAEEFCVTEAEVDYALATGQLRCKRFAPAGVDVLTSRLQRFVRRGEARRWIENRAIAARTLTKSQAARLAGCDRKTVGNAIASGRLKAVEVFGRPRLDPDDVARWARDLPPPDRADGTRSRGRPRERTPVTP